jgi:hypothetical protein
MTADMKWQLTAKLCDQAGLGFELGSLRGTRCQLPRQDGAEFSLISTLWAISYENPQFCFSKNRSSGLQSCTTCFSPWPRPTWKTHFSTREWPMKPSLKSTDSPAQLSPFLWPGGPQVLL